MSSCILSIFPAGAVGPSLQVHNGLDLKQIQLDSLGYLISRHLQTCAHFDQAKEQFNNTLRFFGGNYKDVSICNSLTANDVNVTPKSQAGNYFRPHK